MKFKVGDKVRVVNVSGDGYTLPRGNSYRVTRVSNTHMYIDYTADPGP